MFVETNYQSINIDKNDFTSLQYEAKMAGISCDELINNIIKKYLIFDRVASNVNVMLFRPPFIISILNKISTQDIKILGMTHGIEGSKCMLENLKLPLNYENGIILVKDFLSKRFRWFNADISKENSCLKIYLTHNLNKKWSIYLCEFIVSFFNMIGLSKISSEIDDSSTTINLRISKINF